MIYKINRTSALKAKLLLTSLLISITGIGQEKKPGDLIWKFEVGSDDGYISSPTLDDNGDIYFGAHDNKVYAIYSNGTIKWNFNTGERVYSTPAIGRDNTIYVGSNDDYLYAINSNGSEKWRFKTCWTDRLRARKQLDFTVGAGEAVATRIRRNKNENQVTAGIHAD